MHTIDEAKKLQCRVVGLFTVQRVKPASHGIMTSARNGSPMQTEIEVQTLSCVADKCAHWVKHEHIEYLGRCGFAR